MLKRYALEAKEELLSAHSMSALSSTVGSISLIRICADQEKLRAVVRSYQFARICNSMAETMVQQMVAQASNPKILTFWLRTQSELRSPLDIEGIPVRSGFTIVSPTTLSVAAACQKSVVQVENNLSRILISFIRFVRSITTSMSQDHAKYRRKLDLIDDWVGEHKPKTIQCLRSLAVGLLTTFEKFETTLKGCESIATARFLIGIRRHFKPKPAPLGFIELKTTLNHLTIQAMAWFQGTQPLNFTLLNHAGEAIEDPLTYVADLLHQPNLEIFIDHDMSVQVPSMTVTCVVDRAPILNGSSNKH